MSINPTHALDTLATALFKDADETAPVDQALRRRLAQILIENHTAFFTDCIASGNDDAIPYFQLVNAVALENGKCYQCVDNREKHPVYKIATGAENIALEDAFEAIIRGEQAGHTVSTKESFSDRATAGLDSNKSGFHGSRSTMMFGEKIEKQHGRRRTAQGEYYLGKRLHDAPEGNEDKQAWHFFQALVLNDANNIPPHDFLRQLRLLSGRDVKETGLLLGLKDHTGSNYSKYENGKFKLPLNSAHIILEKNLFSLPVDEKTGKVVDDIRTKFLQKFGHYEEAAEQLAALIKALAINHVRHIAHGGAPKDSPISDLAAKKAGDANGYYRSQLLIELTQHRANINELRKGINDSISVLEVKQNRPDLELPANSDFLPLLPKGNNYIALANDPELSARLAKGLVFEMAEHSPTLSSFLARYQTTHGKIYKEIARDLDLTLSRMSRMLTAPESMSANVARKTDQRRIILIEKIIETNAFDLPTGPMARYFLR